MSKEFIGTCVENPFENVEALSNIIDNAKEITKKTFLKNCYVETGIRFDMRSYPFDYTFYKNKDVYFYTWSAIEHFYR